MSLSHTHNNKDTLFIQDSLSIENSLSTSLYEDVSLKTNISLSHTQQHQHTRTQNTHRIRHRGQTWHDIFVNLRFFRLSRPPKVYRQTEKAKGSKIPQILQRREISAGVELNMCTWKLHTQWTPKKNLNINIWFDRTLCILDSHQIPSNCPKCHLIQTVFFSV